jgi:hypothetical protein
METDKIEKYLKYYVNDVLLPKLNDKMSYEGGEPVKINVRKVTYGKLNPNRINFFLNIEPYDTSVPYLNEINLEISNFFKMLTIDKNLHIYWNKELPFFYEPTI